MFRPLLLLDLFPDKPLLETASRLLLIFTKALLATLSTLAVLTNVNDAIGLTTGRFITYPSVGLFVNTNVTVLFFSALSFLCFKSICTVVLKNGSEFLFWADFTSFANVKLSEFVLQSAIEWLAIVD